MTDLIERVKCNIVITLNDGTNIDVSIPSVGELANVKNYVTDVIIDESLNAQNNNPVGVVSSNTVKIGLRSIDRVLQPDNPNSPYFGKMDNTATIQISLTDVDGVVNFNTFFVSNWTSNITSSDPYKVTIECTDLLGIINKNSVPGEEIVKNISTSNAVKYVVNELNKLLDAKYRINYVDSDINFNEFPVLDYNNIEANNMSTYFNVICQSTLTNLYYTRDNKLKTDYCLDDSPKESVCTLSDKVNIVSASVDKGGLVGYTGVKVNYLINTINEISELTSLSNQVLKPGLNAFENIELTNKVYKVTAVRISTNTTTKMIIQSVTYGRKKANIIINNPTTQDVTCDISIYGQSLRENKLYVQKTKTGSNEILEVTNSLLSKTYIDKFVDGLLSLIGIRASSIKISGFFNPRIKLGDTVYVDVENSINTKGYYKIVSLKWKITNTIRCDASMIKTIVNS